MLMTVLASAGASLTFCEAICGSATAPAHHARHVAAHAHAHAAQATSPASTLQSGSGCKTLAQVSLLRRRSTVEAQSQSASAPPPESLSHFREAVADFALLLSFADRHGPPVAPSPVVPLRV